MPTLILLLILLLAVIALMIPITILTRRSARKNVVNPGNQAISTGNQALLFELEGLSPGKTWQLSSGVTRLGRKASTNDVVLKGLTASRQQAIIRFRGGEFIIESVQADNPILVNDKPVNQPVILVQGDIIQGGESTFRFIVNVTP